MSCDKTHCATHVKQDGLGRGRSPNGQGLDKEYAHSLKSGKLKDKKALQKLLSDFVQKIERNEVPPANWKALKNFMSDQTVSSH